MQTHHVSSHDLALLERFVCDCVQQLPSLPTAVPHQLPQRCSSYHTSCAAMLRHVLDVALAPLSPRACQLIAQVWDLTSLNLFVLIQLAQKSLDEKDSLHTKWRQLQRFCDETTAQHTQRVTKYEAELETVRLESRELRAELQKTRQKANRLAVENAQLRKAVNGLMEMNDSLHSRMVDGITGVEPREDADPSSTTNGNMRSDAEDWELYGVSSEELERLDVVHPLESYAQDFDQLLEGLVDRERDQMALLNEMDRFMNSNVVALLWRHGPDEDNTKFLEQMMNKRTIGSQTEDDELGILSEDLYTDDGDREFEGELHTSRSSDDPQAMVMASGETGMATVMTKRQLLPLSLRAQLTTRPKIQRVLEKDQLSHVLLVLLLEKMETDGMLLRQQPQPQPRVALHRFMKEFFVQRYGLAPLAEYRMMEVVKSVLYYHEKQEAEARRMRLITGAAPPTSASVSSSLQNQQQQHHQQLSSTSSSSFTFSLLPGHDLALLSRDDLRISLFARVCELVPLQWSDGHVAPVTGNLFACATNALLDFVGDVIELDRSISSLRELVGRMNGRQMQPQDQHHESHTQWELSLELASQLVAHHFAYCDAARVELLLRRLEALVVVAPSDAGAASTTTPVSPLSLLSVDALLVFFATQWFDNDQKLTAALHGAFHRHVVRQRERERDSETECGSLSSLSSLSHMETLRRVWTSMGDQRVSPLDLEELELAFEAILALRQSQQHTQHHTQQQQQQQRRMSIKRQSILINSSNRIGENGHSRSRPGSAATIASVSSMGLCVGGISEKEFVFQSQQVLRARRVCRGLRTHGRVVEVKATAMAADGVHTTQTQRYYGARGKVLPTDLDVSVAVASYELKPGLQGDC